MSILKKLAGETAIYGLSSIVGRFLNYLLVPFYTAVFLPEEYGIVTELYSYAAFLNVLFTYGMETTYFRHCNKIGANADLVFNQIQAMLITSTLLLGLPIVVFSNSIADLLQHTGKGEMIIWLALTIAIDTSLALDFARLRQQNRAKKFAFIKISNILLNIGLNVFFLIILPKYFDNEFNTKDVRFVFVANFLANASQILFFRRYFQLWKLPSLEWNTAKSYLFYGLPLMVMGLAGMINEVIDRIVLKFLLPLGFYPDKSSLAAVGIYGACYKLSIFMSLGIQAFRYASEPFFFSKAQDKNSPSLYARVMHWFVFVCTGVLIIISLNLDWIQFVLRNPAYREGLLVVPILLAANLFLGIYYNLSIWYKLTDKTKYGMFINIGGAIFTVILNILLVPFLGYIGSAWATLGCYAAMALASFILGQQNYYVPYHKKFMSVAIIVGITFSFSLWKIEFLSNIPITIATKNAIGLMVLFVLFLFGRKVRSL
jgi:O-antigen/teichoic acid export membrane protein